MNPKINTSVRGRGKWGDFLVAFVPLSWCVNILLNSNFILRMIEWQNESSLFTIRIHGKQWYWVYKFDLKDMLDIWTAPKNVGKNRWAFINANELSVNDFYVQAVQARTKARWLRDYWIAAEEKDIKPRSTGDVFSAYEPKLEDSASRLTIESLTDVYKEPTKKPETEEEAARRIKIETLLKSIVKPKNVTPAKPIVTPDHWSNIVVDFKTNNVNLNVDIGESVTELQALYSQVSVVPAVMEEVDYKNILAIGAKFESLGLEDFDEFILSHVVDKLPCLTFTGTRFETLWTEDIAEFILTNVVDKSPCLAPTPEDTQESALYEGYLNYVTYADFAEASTLADLYGLFGRSRTHAMNLALNHWLTKLTEYTVLDDELFSLLFSDNGEFISDLEELDLLFESEQVKSAFADYTVFDDEFVDSLVSDQGESTSDCEASDLFLEPEQPTYGMFTEDELTFLIEAGRKCVAALQTVDIKDLAIKFNNDITFINTGETLAEAFKLLIDSEIDLENSTDEPFEVLLKNLRCVRSYLEANDIAPESIFDEFDEPAMQDIRDAAPVSIPQQEIIKLNEFNIQDPNLFNFAGISYSPIVPEWFAPQTEAAFISAFTDNAPLTSKANPAALHYYSVPLDDLWDIDHTLRKFKPVGPMRLMKTLLTPENIKNTSDILRVRFNDDSGTSPKVEDNSENFWILKQKRYKKKQQISESEYLITDFYDSRVYTRNDKKPSFLTSRLLLNGAIADAVDSLRLESEKEDEEFTGFAFYRAVRNNKKHGELLPVTLSRRLLRTKKTLVLPAHVNMTLVTNSYDVVHSWFIPGLGIKIDCVPGRSTHHSLYIDNVGFYYGQCAEICGRYHHHMPIRVCALPFEHFLVWWRAKGLPKLLKIKLTDPNKDKERLPNTLYAHEVINYSNLKYYW